VLTPFRIDLVRSVRRLRRFEPPRDRARGAVERCRDGDRVARHAQCSTEIARGRTRQRLDGMEIRGDRRKRVELRFVAGQVKLHVGASHRVRE